MNKDREITKRLVQHVEQRGIKALFITVDAPQLGRRKGAFFQSPLGTVLRYITMQDMRMKFDAEDPSEVKSTGGAGRVDRSQGAARAISVRISSKLEIHLHRA